MTHTNVITLWAVKVGQPDYMEVLITDKAENIEHAKNWALKNGFNRLRTSKIDLSIKPDFNSALAK